MIPDIFTGPDSLIHEVFQILWDPTEKGQGSCSLNWEKNEVGAMGQKIPLCCHLSFVDGCLERQGSESGDVGSSLISATTLP